MTETVEAFWRQYLATLPAQHPHHRIQPDVVAFGDSPALADELAELVRVGN